MSVSVSLSVIGSVCKVISRTTAVSVHTSIPKQLPPSPLPLFIPGSTTAAPFITTQVSDHPAPTDPELSCTCCCQSSQIQSHHSYPPVSIHWLKINERIEYKLLSLTYKVLTTTQPSYLYNLITVQPPRSTRSSSLVTLAHPSTTSSLRIVPSSMLPLVSGINSLPPSVNPVLISPILPHPFL